MSSVPQGRRRVLIDFNPSHYVAGSNKYVMKFKNNLNLSGKHPTICVASYSIYNSTFNITAALENNTLQIKWIDGVTYTHTIDDGCYSLSDLNTNLQYFMSKNRLYMQSSSDSTKQLFFVYVVANSIRYASQIGINYVPNSLPSGYIIPSGATWSLPSSNTFPQLIIPPAMMKLLGFSSQSIFPLSQTAGSQNVAYLSDTAPILSPTFVYKLGSNFVHNSFSSNPTILHSIAVTSSLGQAMSSSTPSIMVSCQEGTYNDAVLTIHDETDNAIVLEDSELLVSLCLEFDE